MPGSETDAMCEYVDVTPTLLDIAGASVPKGLDGKSFLPVIKEKRQIRNMYLAYKQRGALRMGQIITVFAV